VPSACTPSATDGSLSPAKDPRTALQAIYSNLGWLVPDTLAHCPDPPALYYDQVSQVEMQHWTTGRVGLIGDAGYAVSLLAGQGASLAVAGAHLLAAELAKGAEVTEALSCYQARMTAPVIQKQTAGRRTAAWLLPASPIHPLLRRLALRAMRLPGLNSQLVAGVGGIP
jgi:2-polyprenyl-6-methoxyphenol hydroxylase-like FAD-dependent oxidoreductase